MPVPTTKPYDRCPENELRLAQVFLAASRNLGGAIQAIEQMAMHQWPHVAQEEYSADMIVDEGAQVARAMRAMAMRLDRAALLNEPANEGNTR